MNSSDCYRRRLSQCLEADEDDEDGGGGGGGGTGRDSSTSTSSSTTSQLEHHKRQEERQRRRKSRQRRIDVTAVTDLLPSSSVDIGSEVMTTIPPLLSTSEKFATMPASTMTTKTRPHLDPRWVDTSLFVPLRTPASLERPLTSSSDIWLARPTPKDPNLGVVPGSGTDGSVMSSDQYRTRYDTWGSHTAALREHERRQKAAGRAGEVVYHTVTGAVSQGSARQHQVPSIFEVFRPRSKSDAASKKPTLIGSMKNAMQNSLKSQSSTGSEPGEHARGPVAKVIHLFRHRSQSATSAEEKRKARAAALHQQQVAAHTAYLKGAARRLSLEKRRLSLGTTGTLTGSGHRGSEPSLDPNHAAILFRDSRGLPVADPFLEKVSMSDLEEDESQIYVKFFKFHKSYGLIPTSAKLVVFDTQLLVKKAFFALVYNGVRAAPLWDSVEHRFVGMLTITDFIKILQMNYATGSMTMDQMEEHKLDTWRSVLKDQSRDLISIGPDASLYDAIKTLIHNHIHRLPVIDYETGNVLYILTHKRILRFLFLYMNDLPRPSFLNKSLGELRIGTFDYIETATEDTTIITALDKFVERRVSALPIVDDQRRLVDIFAKFDVINLAADKTYDKLDVSLKKANEHRNEWFEGVHKCSMDDTLFSIIEKIVRAEVHRLVVTDDEDRVIGILSLSDLLQYLVLRPCGEEIESRPVTPLSELIGGGGGTSEETILEDAEGEENNREKDYDDAQDEEEEEEDKSVSETLGAAAVDQVQTTTMTEEQEDDDGDESPVEQRLESPLNSNNSSSSLQPSWREVTVSGGE